MNAVTTHFAAAAHKIENAFGVPHLIMFAKTEAFQDALINLSDALIENKKSSRFVDLQTGVAGIALVDEARSFGVQIDTEGEVIVSDVKDGSRFYLEAPSFYEGAFEFHKEDGRFVCSYAVGRIAILSGTREEVEAGFEKLIAFSKLVQANQGILQREDRNPLVDKRG
jgi:hypothetical protein